MLAAAVVTAGVTSLAVLVVMVVTVNIGIVAQISAEQCAHRRISVPADTAVELDARFGQSLPAHRRRCLRKSKCPHRAALGSLPVRRDRCRWYQRLPHDDFAVRSFIKLELFGVAEMLKNLTVFIGNCNFHNGISFASFA